MNFPLRKASGLSDVFASPSRPILKSYLLGERFAENDELLRSLEIDGNCRLQRHPPARRRSLEWPLFMN